MHILNLCLITLINLLMKCYCYNTDHFSSMVDLLCVLVGGAMTVLV